MSEKQRLFDEAFNSWKQEPTDNPENIPFYRAFAGLRAAWGEDFYKNYNHVIHHVAGSMDKRADNLYNEALRQLSYYEGYSVTYKLPEQPRPRYSYSSEPAAPGEKDAKEYFNREYKRVYPEKRLNSKDAHEKWTANKGKALEIVFQTYSKALADYRAHEKALNIENDSRQREWENKIQEIAIFEDSIRSILKEEVSYAASL